MRNGVLIFDFGSQYTQLIARRVRELGVYSELVPCSLPYTPERAASAHAIILSGGPASVTDDDAPEFDPRWLDVDVPLLGVCYGMQLLAHHGGGAIEGGLRREYGHATIELCDTKGLFSTFAEEETTTVWMSHGDHVVAPPRGFSVIATSSAEAIAAIADHDRRRYGVQFHPEVAHTPRGIEILRSFLFEVAGCEATWTAGSVIERTTASALEAVPEGKNAICALSGGVDSTVAAFAIAKALGPRLHCIFVDNGLLRLHEAEQVARALGPEGLGLNLHVVRAADRFLAGLRGVTDPEQKRKIIGRLFIEIFEEEAHRIPNVTHLVQGTLYPDVIESSAPSGKRGPSVTIKTHHNVGGLPERMKLKLLEPFRELFKDEVRRAGRELGMSESLLLRQPFPGPGLAVRVLGEVTAERLEMLRLADAIFHEEVVSANLYESIWQSFAVLLPVKSVGVMGDGRTYEETIALRAVTSEDGMTADWAYLPHDLLRRTSSRIINEVQGVNRVVYDISSKPPSTIEWE